MLALADVHTYYGDSYVLHGTSLQARAGEVTVLMGRNGVGKTTTVRTIMALTPARSGTVTFDGRDVTRLRTDQIAHLGVGLVPQGRRIFPSLTVREHLTAVRRSGTTWPLERVFELFPPLRERFEQRAAHLSGGEQSMLATARALRTEPRCLLMDEPTEGLAPRYVEIMLDVIKQLRGAGGIAILAVLPEMPLALEVADRIFVMGKGRVVYDGTRDEFARRDDIHHQFIGVG